MKRIKEPEPLEKDGKTSSSVYDRHYHQQLWRPEQDWASVVSHGLEHLVGSFPSLLNHGPLMGSREGRITVCRWGPLLSPPDSAV